jgi:nucleotide-binding universal stress UspA family protein
VRLLCATDLSPPCELAVDRAGQIGETLGADVSLLHVVPPVPSERALEESLKVAIGYMRARGREPMWRWSTVPNIIVRTGSPTRIIAETVQRLTPHVLVLGARKRSGLRSALEGSVAERVLRAQECPVLIVRNTPAEAYRKVVLALDTTEPSVAALQVAERLVLRPDSVARVIHAYEPPYRGMLRFADIDQLDTQSYLNAWRNEATMALRDFLKSFSADFSRYEIEVEDRKPAASIRQCVERERPDLLVVGTRASGTLHRAFTGSVARDVVHDVKCDVLVVPHRGSALARREGRSTATLPFNASGNVNA